MTQRPRRSGSSRGLRARACAALLVGFLLATAAAPALADEYDPKRAGHPLRIAAYALHPVGVLIDFLIMRPAYWLGSHEPLRTIFGQSEDGY